MFTTEYRELEAVLYNQIFALPVLASRGTLFFLAPFLLSRQCTQ